MRLLADCIRRRLVGLPVRITPVACRAASIRQRSCFRIPPRPAVKDSQFVLCRFEAFSLRRVDFVARPVDVEGQHGHCRAERTRPATRATLGGSLQRQGNIAGIGPSEDTRLQVQRVAGPGDVVRPSLSLVGHPAVSPGVSLCCPHRRWPFRNAAWSSACRYSRKRLCTYPRCLYDQSPEQGNGLPFKPGGPQTAHRCVSEFYCVALHLVGGGPRGKFTPSGSC